MRLLLAWLLPRVLSIAPAIVGGAIAAGASLIGGAMSSRAERRMNEDTIRYNTQKEERDAELQREFAQNGIRWRVEDAQAAGLHPLYALGGSGATFSPSPVSMNLGNPGAHMGKALADAGQHVGRAVSAQETQDERNFKQAQLRALEASTDRDLAQAFYWRSEAMRKAEGDRVSGPFPPDVVTNAYGSDVVLGAAINRPRIEAHPLYSDAVKLKPDDMASRSAEHQGQTAGRDHPGMRQFDFPGGFRALLPASGDGGIPDEIDASMLPLVIGANLERYGWRWLVDLAGYATGRSPDSRRGNTLESWLRGMQLRLPKSSDFGLPHRRTQ